MEVLLKNDYDSLQDMEVRAAYAALVCRANSKNDFTAKQTLKRIIALHHDSILEHIVLHFEVCFLSRACLQEFSRHRIVSPSVESTRHSLKKCINNPDWVEAAMFQLDDWLKPYFIQDLEVLRQNIDLPNDKLKLLIRDYWPTNLVFTVNLRELRHIIALRSAPDAWGEFRILADKLAKSLPDEFQYWVEDVLWHSNEN